MALRGAARGAAVADSHPDPDPDADSHPDANAVCLVLEPAAGAAARFLVVLRVGLVAVRVLVRPRGWPPRWLGTVLIRLRYAVLGVALAAFGAGVPAAIVTGAVKADTDRSAGRARRPRGLLALSYGTRHSVRARFCLVLPVRRRRGG